MASCRACARSRRFHRCRVSPRGCARSAPASRLRFVRRSRRRAGTAACDTAATLREPLLSARGALPPSPRSVRTARRATPSRAFTSPTARSAERLDWLADTTPRGLRQSFGIMVNYRYALDRIAPNQLAYATGHHVEASSAVRWLARCRDRGERGRSRRLTPPGAARRDPRRRQPREAPDRARTANRRFARDATLFATRHDAGAGAGLRRLDRAARDRRPPAAGHQR